jgi:hypothetical protein
VFSSYAVYQAAQLSAWSDPVVIGALGVAGAYLLAGGFVMKVSGGLGISLRSRSEEAVVELNDEDEDEAVTLLSNEEEEKGGFAVRCPSCARVYSATLADATCPDCGRGAIAV